MCLCAALSTQVPNASPVIKDIPFHWDLCLHKNPNHRAQSQQNLHIIKCYFGSPGLRVPVGEHWHCRPDVWLEVAGVKESVGCGCTVRFFLLGNTRLSLRVQTNTFQQCTCSHPPSLPKTLPNKPKAKAQSSPPTFLSSHQTTLPFFVK